MLHLQRASGRTQRGGLVTIQAGKIARRRRNQTSVEER